MCTACVILYCVNQPLTESIQIDMVSKSDFFLVVCDSLIFLQSPVVLVIIFLIGNIYFK